MTPPEGSADRAGAAVMPPTPEATAPLECNAESLRELLEARNVLRGSRVKLPSQDALSSLADTVNYLKRRERDEVRLDRKRDQISSAVRLIKELTTVLLDIHDDLKVTQTPFHQSSSVFDYLQHEIIALEALMDSGHQVSLLLKQPSDISMLTLMTRIGLEASRKRAKARWHAYLPVVEADFREAMATTNPDLHLGRKADSPLVRFLVKILPLITGETATAAAVEKQLKAEGGVTNEAAISRGRNIRD